MARRRMFSKDIVFSARFLKLPPRARLLYYDLGMQADDDGVVEAYTVLVTTGADVADLELLEERGFVRILNGDYVSHVVDWKRNNLLKKDRYTPSIYANLLQDYDGTQMEPKWNPNGTQMEPQDRLGEDRGGEGRLGQVSVGEDRSACGASLPYPPTKEDVEKFAREKGLVVDCGKFHDYYQQREWRQSNGKPLKQWGMRLARWAESEYNQPAGGQCANSQTATENQREMKNLLRRLNGG